MTVVLQTEVVGDAGSHRHSGYTGITDERVDLLILRQEQVHDLHEAHTTHRSYEEGTGTDGEDIDGVQGEKLTGLGGAAYRQTEQDDHNVVQG